MRVTARIQLPAGLYPTVVSGDPPKPHYVAVRDELGKIVGTIGQVELVAGEGIAVVMEITDPTMVATLTEGSVDGLSVGE